LSSSDDFKLTLAHTEKLLDRRQSTTSFYLSVNTGILAVIGLLIKDSSFEWPWLMASVLLLLCAGFMACCIWRSLLRQYEILLEWWYARLRELEASMPDSAQLVSREYQELYLEAKHRRASQRIGMTKRELALNWVFTGLYAVFAVGVVVSLLLQILAVSF
jgi:hypothetical protein